MMSKIKPVLFFIVPLFLLISGRVILNAQEEFKQVSAAIQASSTISDGNLSIAEIVSIAKKNGRQVVIITDRDYLKWEYGLWPLRNIIKKTEKMPAVVSYGIDKYLKEIKEAQAANPDMVIIPGVESAPFYYWQGKPFGQNFKISDWHKHILVIGLDKVEDYKNLPSVANKSSLALPFSFKDIYLFWPVLVLAAGILSLKKRKFNYKDNSEQSLGPYSSAWRVFGILLMIIGMLGLVNNFPFRHFKYDQYHGEQGVRPYQELFDYANSIGALTFWAHPEAENIEKRGPIAIETKDYSADLLATRDFTGFAIFYEGFKKVGRIGGIWDDILNEYCAGRRKTPVWAIGALAYDQGSSLDSRLQGLDNILLVKSLDAPEVMKALRDGKLYVVRGNRNLRLHDFSITDAASGPGVTMGEELRIKGNPLIKIEGGYPGGETKPININLVRNGISIKKFALKSPFMIRFYDSYHGAGDKIYYRLEIRGPDSIIVTNPIFINFGG